MRSGLPRAPSTHAGATHSPAAAPALAVAPQGDIQHWPFTVVRGPDNKPLLEGGPRRLLPPPLLLPLLPLAAAAAVGWWLLAGWQLDGLWGPGLLGWSRVCRLLPGLLMCGRAHSLAPAVIGGPACSSFMYAIDPLERGGHEAGAGSGLHWGVGRLAACIETLWLALRLRSPRPGVERGGCRVRCGRAVLAGWLGPVARACSGVRALVGATVLEGPSRALASLPCIRGREGQQPRLGCRPRLGARNAGGMRGIGSGAAPAAAPAQPRPGRGAATARAASSILAA